MSWHVIELGLVPGQGYPLPVPPEEWHPWGAVEARVSSQKRAAQEERFTVETKTQSSEVLVERRRFTIQEYHKMAEAGILHEDDRVELIGEGDNRDAADRGPSRGVRDSA